MYVEPKPLNEYPWFIRLFFWKQKKTYGQVLDPGKIWGRSPVVFATLALFFGAINRKKSPVPGPLRALAQVRVSMLNRCSFCTDINMATLLKRGVDPEKVSALAEWRDSPLFDDLEKLILEYTETIISCDRQVEDELMGQLKKHFDDDAIVELTGVICFQDLSAKFNAALKVPAQGFCALPSNKSD